MKIKSLFKNSQYWVAIVLFALLAHGLIFLNDGLFVDDWLIYSDLMEKRWDNVQVMFAEAGVPTTTYIHWAMGYFGNIIFAYRLLDLVSILLSALLIYRICFVLGWFSRVEALLIALISMTYPAMQVSFELIIVPSYLYLCLFLLAVYLALLSEGATGAARYACRALSVIGFLLSFSLHSLLVYYFGFLLLLFLFTARPPKLSLKAIVKGFLFPRLDFVLLPFVFWFLKEYLFPRSGLYASYNQFNLTPGSLVYTTLYSLKYAIIGQLFDSLKAIIEHPVLALLLLTVIQLIYPLFKNGSTKPSAGSANSHVMIGFGLVLLGLGMFPYVVVGLWPTQHGFSTRHALLVALPVAIIIVGLLRLIALAKRASFSRLIFTGVMLPVMAFTLATIDNHISWQARWIKDRSIILNLKLLEGARSKSVFWIDDPLPKAGEDFYRFFEWSSMFKAAWGEESHVGFDQKFYPPDSLSTNRKYFSSRYNLSTLDPEGCQVLLKIRGGPLAASDQQLVSSYMFYRFLHPDQLDDYLRKVTALEMQPVTTGQAPHCLP
jgi:hypothetical protein